MKRIVDDLFLLARADAGDQPLVPSEMYLDEVADEQVRALRTLATAKSIAVERTGTDELPYRGDEMLLRRMLTNLLDNAIKYTPAGGRVELSLSHRMGQEIAFTVRDTGIGMSAADLSHVFERFWRADRARSRTSERGGFGLGLAISQWIAQAHGGRIAVQSRLGRGSVFTVTLPLISPTAHAAANQLRRELEEAREARDVRDARDAARAGGGDPVRPPAEGGKEAGARDIGD